MEYIPRHKKSVVIEFAKNDDVLLRVTFPKKNNKINLNISNFYKSTKQAVASSNEVPLWKVKGSHKIIDSVYHDRILFEWPGGIALNIPDDTSKYEYEIIIHYLEGLKMAASNPRTT